MPRSGSLWGGLLLVFAVGPVAAYLPTVDARLDTQSTTLGEPLGLKLVLSYEQSYTPEVGVLLPPASELTSEQVGPPKLRDVDDGKEMVLEYHIRAYRLGVCEVPSVKVVFVGVSGDTLHRYSTAQSFDVVSVRSDDESGPRDILPPREIEGGVPLWAAAVMGVVAVLAILIGVLWLLDRRRGGEEVPSPRPVDFAGEFHRIAGLGLLERGDYKTYYSLLADNLRHYLEDRLQVEAMERTTLEVNRDLLQNEIGQEIAGDVEVFLRAADMVKFARDVPSVDEARNGPEAGRAILQKADKIIFDRRHQEELQEASAET